MLLPHPCQNASTNVFPKFLPLFSQAISPIFQAPAFSYYNTPPSTNTAQSCFHQCKLHAPPHPYQNASTNTPTPHHFKTLHSLHPFSTSCPFPSSSNLFEILPPLKKTNSSPPPPALSALHIYTFAFIKRAQFFFKKPFLLCSFSISLYSFNVFTVFFWIVLMFLCSFYVLHLFKNKEIT